MNQFVHLSSLSSYRLETAQLEFLDTIKLSNSEFAWCKNCLKQV